MERLRFLEKLVKTLVRDVWELRRREWAVPLRTPLPPNALTPYVVQSYTEPTKAGQMLSAVCVITDGVETADEGETANILIHSRVPVGDTIFAARTSRFGTPGDEPSSGSGSGEDDNGTWHRWVQVPFSPGAILAKTVCEGPKGEDRLDPPGVWCRVQQITALCDHATAWTLADAPDILDPCGDGGATIPHIVEGVNLGKQVAPEPIQPGKLVLLTPLAVISSPNRPRYAISYIDPDDNGEQCEDSSSSSSGDDYVCWQRYRSTYDCSSKSWSTPEPVPGANGCGRREQVKTEWTRSTEDGCIYEREVASEESYATEAGCENCPSATYVTPPTPNFEPLEGDCCDSSESDSDSSTPGDFTCYRTKVATWSCESKAWSITETGFGCGRIGNIRRLWVKTGDFQWTMDQPVGDTFETEAGCSGCAAITGPTPNPPNVDADKDCGSSEPDSSSTPDSSDPDSSEPPGDGYTGDETVVTAWNAETCEVTTKVFHFVNGRLMSVT